MDSGYVFDDLGEALNEGDVVIMDGLAWLVTKIYIPQAPPIVDPTVKLPTKPMPLLVKVQLNTEVTLNQILGGRLVKVYRSSKKMTPKPNGNSASE